MKTMHVTNLVIKENREISQKLRNGYEGGFFFFFFFNGGREIAGILTFLFVVVTFNARAFLKKCMC